MSDAIEDVAKALYYSNYIGTDYSECIVWETDASEALRQTYRDRARIAIDAHNACIRAEAKHPGSAPKLVQERPNPDVPKLLRDIANTTYMRQGDRDIILNAAADELDAWRNGHNYSLVIPVLQDWVMQLTLMQQTVLLTAIRGPDNTPKYSPVKMLMRWYRRCVLLSAMDKKVLTDPMAAGGGSFTGPSFVVNNDYDGNWEKLMSELVDDYLRTLDALPHHFQLHFMHAAEIVGYKHPDLRIRAWWNLVYNVLVNDMHVHPETEAEMDKRLSDNREAWLARNNPATVD